MVAHRRNRRLVVKDVGRIDVEEQAVPRPAEREVLVEIAFSGVCHTDHSIVNGGHATALYPVVPGHEFSGTIRAVGAEVTDFAPGDRIAAQTQLGCGRCMHCSGGDISMCPVARELGSTTDGGWQRFIVLPEAALFEVPPELSLAEAALIEPAANGRAAARQAAITEDDVVVVVGPGPIGLLTAQFARLYHPRRLILVGRSGDEKRLALGCELGADDTLLSDDTGRTELAKQTDGRGADVILQCAGSVQATEFALQNLGRKGRLIIEGYAASPQTVPLVPDLLTVNENIIQGVRGWRLADFRLAIELARRGLIKLEPLITHRFELDEFQTALDTSVDYSSGAIKVLFEPNRAGPDAIESRTPEKEHESR